MKFKLLLFLLIISFLPVNNSAQNSDSEKLVMINPAGDANNPGRKIGFSNERNISFQLADKIKNSISSNYKVKSVLTREPREVVYPLQIASFANRFNTNFFISLHIFPQENPKPSIYIYYQLYNPMVDLATHKFNNFEFISIYQAHFANIRNSIALATKMENTLRSSQFNKLLDVYGPYGLPLVPLLGIQSSSVLIEAGISDENDLPRIIQPIVESLQFLKD
ncbi:TPA: hypothetical protein DEO28_02245 [Candidatus Dependentiae bacterium]|nr:MAG: Sporulation specific N-acetylmuramoyl-L-alanine amidase [candidate division TM6 bacterium GW2011_GWE2_31_21]KKP52555.1 MAG: Sporulation specific N-acetylmuramoyl-L-alanine amidase [candidate division TM6 bacterium GW2011_GWF2_33_332]HBS48461.1 hypothetical protein [Candidatus Dependentiae bacterium]HBZ73310.1 hypothetical protein [Candidatus Dependentiae bacterium]